MKMSKPCSGSLINETIKERYEKLIVIYYHGILLFYSYKHLYGSGTCTMQNCVLTHVFECMYLSVCLSASTKQRWSERLKPFLSLLLYLCQRPR